jgi:hypothetical protein
MRENVMTAFLLAFMVILMAKTLAGIYLGEAYVCPSCGAEARGRARGRVSLGSLDASRVSCRCV